MRSTQMVLQLVVGGEAKTAKRAIEVIQVEAVVVGRHRLGHQRGEGVGAPLAAA